MLTVSLVPVTRCGMVAAREEVMTIRRTEGTLEQDVSMPTVPYI